MVECVVTVTGQLGLHARAAARLVRVASRFDSNIRLERRDGNAADAKSILSVLMLAASCGTELRVVAQGTDEQEALAAICSAFLNGFGETRVSPEPVAARAETRWKALGVSDGIAIGRVLRMHNDAQYVYRSRLDSQEVESELWRFRAALRLARQQLLAIKSKAENELGKDHSYVFDAHLLLLEDQKLTGDVERYIVEEHSNTEWAVKVLGDRLISLYADIKDDYLRERSSDIEDVVQRLLVALSGERPQERNLTEDAVIVSQELLPSTVAELDLKYARAIVTDTGGWTSHTAIIARGLGIPAVVGLRDFYRHTRTGDEIVVDSINGEVILHPSPATLERYRSESVTNVIREPVELGYEYATTRTQDGLEIRMRANVEVPAEFEGVKRYRARGIGLYRSEFLLSRRGVMVAEDEQYAAYAEIARLAGEDGAIVRLFDLGGEQTRGPAEEPERNPALGLRGIRFGLLHESIMRTQVRAILRAATQGRLDIVLPMVSDVGDVSRAKLIVEEEAASLKDLGLECGTVRIGAMIEVPSAVLTAEKIARSADFFELGTNDLVQYTLAVDRSSDQVSEWFRTLHPAVLTSIEQSLKAARQAGIPAIVCGEMASTPAYAVLLVGLGAVDLSMTPSSIPRVRRMLANIDSREAQTIAHRCLDCSTADEVEDLMRERFQVSWPESFTTGSLPQPRADK
jgi:phosphoenolpyruvate-protein phosphotransferase (PTS system enzyme I)